MKKYSLWALAAVALCTQVLAAHADGQSPLLIQTAGASAAATKPAQPASAAQPAVAAEVNGDKIMMSDIDRMLADIAEHEPSLKSDSPEARTAKETLRQRILDSQIRWRLLVQEAHTRGIVPTEADVDEGLSQLRGEGVTDAQFAKMIAEDGKTMAEVRQFVTDKLAVDTLTDKLTAGITKDKVSDDAVAKFYKDNPDQWVAPPVAKAHHILLLVKPGTSDADKAKIRARAVNILAKAKARGADFEALARQYSEDPAVKMANTNGNLGEFTAEQMVKPFSDAVFAAKTGAVIGPIETEYGYHIILVDSLTPGSKLPIDDVRDDIKAALVRQMMQDELEKQVTALRSAAHIKKNI